MYNETLAARVRELLADTDNKVDEKVMFSGVTFMVNDKMCVSIGKDRIMLRLSPADYEVAIEQPGAEPMVHGGKVMKGFVFISEDVLSTQSKLMHWVTIALAFNKVAKAAPKKKK